MKRFYIAAQFEKEGKYAAAVIPVGEYDNLLSKLKFTYHPMISANICTSKKQAATLVTEWVKMFKENGIYLFDECPF